MKKMRDKNGRPLQGIVRRQRITSCFTALKQFGYDPYDTASFFL